jgi:hypothetical protein
MRRTAFTTSVLASRHLRWLPLLVPAGMLGCTTDMPSEPPADSTVLDQPSLAQLLVLTATLDDALVTHLLGALGHHDESRPLTEAVAAMRAAITTRNVADAMRGVRAAQAGARRLAASTTIPMTDRVAASVLDLVFTALVQRADSLTTQSDGDR